MIRRIALSVALFVCAVSRVTTAQQPDSINPHDVQPERPTVATHAGTVARGWFEIEGGVERDRLARSTSWTTPTVFKIGLASNVQLGIFGSVAQPVDVAAGFGDIGVGVKWRLLDDAKVLGDFAILPAIKFPTGSQASGRGTGTTDASILLISSYKFGPVAMDLNAGYTRRSGNGSSVPKNATIWNASFGGSAVGPLGWVTEFYGYPATQGPAGQSSIVAVLAGPTYLPRGWLEFDTGIIIPLAGAQPHALYVGSVINIGRIW